MWGLDPGGGSVYVAAPPKSGSTRQIPIGSRARFGYMVAPLRAGEQTQPVGSICPTLSSWYVPVCSKARSLTVNLWT